MDNFEWDSSISSALNFVKNKNWEKLVFFVNTLTLDFPNISININQNSQNLKFGQVYSLLWSNLYNIVMIIWKKEEVEFSTTLLFFETLKSCCDSLCTKVTPWLHIFIYHVPYFIFIYKHIFFSVGHSFEGRHRLLRRHLRMSAKGVKFMDRIGYEQPLRLDNIRFNLLNKPPPCTRRVDRTKSSCALYSKLNTTNQF